MRYYIDGESKRAILKIWNQIGLVTTFRIKETKKGNIKIVKVKA